MKLVRFVRDFDFSELIDRKNCVFCKVMGIRAFKASDKAILVSNEAASAALTAGAAIEASRE